MIQYVSRIEGTPKQPMPASKDASGAPLFNPYLSIVISTAGQDTKSHKIVSEPEDITSQIRIEMDRIGKEEAEADRNAKLENIIVSFYRPGPGKANRHHTIFIYLSIAFLFKSHFIYFAHSFMY